MLAPTYVSENSPRAIRGFLVGFFQLLLVMGGMMAYFINYGALLHLPVCFNSTLSEREKKKERERERHTVNLVANLNILYLYSPEQHGWFH